MILKANVKEINLVPTTKKIVEISGKYQNTNLNDLFFEAYRKNDLKILANIIFELVDEKEVFNKGINQVYDFIDEWKQANSKSYHDLFSEIARMINDEGFFSKKMTDEEIQGNLNGVITSTDMTQMIKSATEKIVSEAVSEELAEDFKGYQA